MDDMSWSPEKAFSQTLVFFTFRKILRQHGGSFQSNRSNGLTLGLLVLWLISFGIYSATWHDGILSIQFKPPESSSVESKAKYLVGTFVYLLNFVLVLIAIFWNVGSMVLWFFIVVLLATVVDLSTQKMINDKERMRFALSVLRYTATSVLGLIVLTCFWNYDFVPSFVRWRFGKMQTAHSHIMRTRASFPIWTFARFLFLLLIMMPVWIPVLIALAVIVLASFMGLPTEIFFPFDVLFRLEPNYWKMTVAELNYEYDDGSFIRTRIQYGCERKGCLAFFGLPYLQPDAACFSYEGACSLEDHLPHGDGIWRDSDNAGEFLRGQWNDGLPLAPFESREYKTGGVFKAVRIGAITCSSAGVDSIQRNQDFLAQNCYSVSSTEVCVAGRWFEGFPYTNYLVGKPGGPEPQGEVLTKVLHALGVEGNTASSRCHEILLFVPGFNSSLNSSLATFSQFLTLGGYPENLIPFCFQWPGLTIMSFLKARVNAQSSRLHEHLMDFLLQLQDMSFTKVHLIGHSMGARVLLSFLQANSNSFSGSLKFGALIFPNPEADLITFVKSSKMLEDMMESITIYSDQGDSALSWAQTINSIFLAKECKELEKGNSCQSLGKVKTVLRRNHCVKDGNLLFEESSPLSSNLVSPFVRYSPFPGGDGEELIDCDIIDTSLVKERTDKSRHSYFHLSRELLEDTRELLVTGKRASSRKSRLVLREGNLYGWLQAPP